MLPPSDFELPIGTNGNGPPLNPDGTGSAPGASGAGPTRVERAIALIEVLICSDYPTQLALGATFAALGYRPSVEDGGLSVGYVFMLSLVDTALLIGLILLFLRSHGESVSDVLWGQRSLRREATAGVPLIVAAMVLGIGTLAMVRQFAPSLHTVDQNPLEDLIRGPRDIWIFAFVVVVAGGIREEVQRAFILRRFEVSLGGKAAGVVIASIAFGYGHLLQGADAAIATGVLGAFWGVIYLKRRSIVAPVISHSGFNLLQILEVVMTRR